MSRQITSILSVLVVVSLLGGGAMTASAAQTDVAIRSVNVSVDQPAPGEAFTLTTTVANLQTSSGPVDVQAVYVRRAGSTREFARIENVGSIPVDGTLSIPLTMKINNPGEKRLTVKVVVEGPDGNFTRVEYPLFVDVQEPDEAVLSFADLDTVAGQERGINITVANGDDGALSNVVLELDGDATVENRERVTASLQPGSQTTHTFQVTFPDPGQQTLNAMLTYKTSRGNTRTVQRDVTVDVERAVVDTDLRASVVVDNGSSAIDVSLTEYGNVELREGQLRAVANGETVERALIPDVAAESTRTVTLDSRSIPAGNVTIVVAYTAAGERRTANTTVRYSPAPSAAVSLIGVETSKRGDILTLSGNVTNVGTAAATSVQVSVTETGSVRPVSPAREHFVGRLDASGSATFELTANASADIGEVPVEIQYTVDGERLTESVPIDVSDATAPSAAISLTGVDFSARDGVLTVSGDAANVGTKAARSVLVSVVETADVTPVAPRKEYFVGAVSASEFATFELTANVSETVDAMPVEIQYTVDGVRLTEVVRVDVDSAAARSGADQSGGQTPLIGVGFALIVVLVIVGGVYRWRRQ
jgi:hypothetical protein